MFAQMYRSHISGKAASKNVCKISSIFLARTSGDEYIFCSFTHMQKIERQHGLPWTLDIE